MRNQLRAPLLVTDNAISFLTALSRAILMKSIRAAILPCFLMILLTGPCRSEDGQLRTILEGRYAAMKSAMTSHDAKEVASLLAPDFVSIDVSGGTQTGDQMIESVRRLPPNDPDKVSNTTLLAIEANGDKAVVKQRYNMKTVKTAGDGTKHQVELTTLSTDAWIVTRGTWLMQRTATDRMDYLVDGKAMLHKVRKPAP
jgi:ketosteroid isomerase-like protein